MCCILGERHTDIYMERAIERVCALLTKLEMMLYHTEFARGSHKRKLKRDVHGKSLANFGKLA
jgi:hypothetical protein